MTTDPPPDRLLEIRTGARVRRVPLRNGLTVGRCRTRDVCLPDDYLLARRHGVFSRTVEDDEAAAVWESAGGSVVLRAGAGRMPLGSCTVELVLPASGRTGWGGPSWLKGRTAQVSVRVAFAAILTGFREMTKDDFMHGMHLACVGFGATVYFIFGCLVTLWGFWRMASGASGETSFPLAGATAIVFCSACVLLGYLIAIRNWSRTGGGRLLMRRLAGTVCWATIIYGGMFALSIWISATL